MKSIRLFLISMLLLVCVLPAYALKYQLSPALSGNCPPKCLKIVHNPGCPATGCLSYDPFDPSCASCYLGITSNPLFVAIQKAWQACFDRYNVDCGDLPKYLSKDNCQVKCAESIFNEFRDRIEAACNGNAACVAAFKSFLYLLEATGGTITDINQVTNFCNGEFPDYSFKASVGAGLCQIQMATAPECYSSFKAFYGSSATEGFRCDRYEINTKDSASKKTYCEQQKGYIMDPSKGSGDGSLCQEYHESICQKNLAGIWTCNERQDSVVDCAPCATLKPGASYGGSCTINGKGGTCLYSNVNKNTGLQNPEVSLESGRTIEQYCKEPVCLSSGPICGCAEGLICCKTAYFATDATSNSNYDPTCKDTQETSVQKDDRYGSYVQDNVYCMNGGIIYTPRQFFNYMKDSEITPDIPAYDLMSNALATCLSKSGKFADQTVSCNGKSTYFPNVDCPGYETEAELRRYSAIPKDCCVGMGGQFMKNGKICGEQIVNTVQASGNQPINPGTSNPVNPSKPWWCLGGLVC
ncbi:MAG: hypothetical protein ABIJ34_05990 [archaeon]